MSKETEELIYTDILKGIPTVEYFDYLNKGYSMADALRAARVFNKFCELEQGDKVRFQVDEYEGEYDFSYLDTWGEMTEGMKKVVKRRIANKIKKHGLSRISAHVRTGEEWREVGAMSGFVGDEWKHSGFDINLMQAALYEVEKESIEALKESANDTKH